MLTTSELYLYLSLHVVHGSLWESVQAVSLLLDAPAHLNGIQDPKALRVHDEYTARMCRDEDVLL